MTAWHLFISSFCLFSSLTGSFCSSQVFVISAAATDISDERAFALIVLIGVTVRVRGECICVNQPATCEQRQPVSLWIANPSSIPVFPPPFGPRLPLSDALCVKSGPPSFVVWIHHGQQQQLCLPPSLASTPPSVPLSPSLYLQPQLRLPSSLLLSVCPSRGERTEMGKGLLDSLRTKEKTQDTRDVSSFLCLFVRGVVVCRSILWLTFVKWRE